MSLSISRFGLGLGFALVMAGAGCFATDEDLDSPEGNTSSPGDSTEALTAVTGFGSNPGALKMYTYSPSGVGPNAPLVVAMHGCTQGAQDYVKAGWNNLADTWKFHVVYPEQQTANSSVRCFNWFEPGDTTRDQGEALSIKQMVDWAIANLSVDASRVYVTGLSAGAAMTSALLAVYPDVFAGGAIIGGIPFKCAQNQSDMTKCMSPGMDKTPAAWGQLVRGAVPDAAGRRAAGRGTTPSRRTRGGGTGAAGGRRQRDAEAGRRLLRRPRRAHDRDAAAKPGGGRRCRAHSADPRNRAVWLAWSLFPRDHRLPGADRTTGAASRPL